MKLGRLNRRLRIERRETGSDTTYGSAKVEWVKHVEVWAEVQDILPSRSERLDDNVSIARRPARVRMRYRSDITSNMQVVLDGRRMRIVAGPAELGRREGTEFMVEELSTAGSEP